MMPIDYKDYPSNWLTEIRPRILKRAKSCCEQCGVRNKSTIWRHPHDDCCHVWSYDIEDGWRWYGQRHDIERVTVCLTIAHVYDPDPMNVSDKNLMALCEACHNRLDASMRAMNKIRKHNQELENLGQLRMF